jgi:hypothetical protein
MLTRTQRLKDILDITVCDVTVRYQDLLIDISMQQQRGKMNRHLTHIQNYEDRYEQSANRAAQFLLFIKGNRVPQKKHTPNIPQYLLLSLTERINMWNAFQVLKRYTEIFISTGKRQVAIDKYVKLMSTPAQHASVCVTGVNRVNHISCVTSDRIWISNWYKLILIDTTGTPLHRVTDISLWYGVHTVNSCGELIYIDSDYNINKLSTDNKTVTALFEYKLPWEPRCVYCSPTTGDLMVGMYNTDSLTARVSLYSETLHHILTIQNDNTGHMIYRDPIFITENKNSDIVVSDNGHRAVVVTERGGRHRFSYTGYPLGSSLRPWGICTDALSHILVCDVNSHTVQMIDKDGHFLSFFLTRQHGIYGPRGLGYDDKTNLLWVGSCYKTMCAYRYIQRRFSLTGKY